MGANESNNLQPVGMTYFWQVEKYSDTWPSKPKFSAPFEVFEDSYRLELQKEETLEIKLHQKKESDVLRTFRCSLTLLDIRGIRYYSQTKEVKIGKGIDNVVLLSAPHTLLEDELRDVLLDNFCISLKISSVDDSSKSSAVDMNSTTETLSSDLEKLYGTQIDSDVEIRTNSDEYFKAHRLILSARSPVFEAMFRHSTTERDKGVVNITDIEVPILDSLLFYIYTGKVHGLDSSTAIQLIQAANKYDLQDLKDICLEFLLQNLTMDNIYDAVVLSEMVDISSLKKEVHTFISKNTAEVIQSEKWQALQEQNPDMVNSILTTVLISAKVKEK